MDILTPAFAVSFSFSYCFLVNVSVITGTRLIATAVEKTCGKLMSVCAVPLSSPYMSTISKLVYPIAPSLFDTMYESIIPMRGAMDAPMVIGTAMYKRPFTTFHTGSCLLLDESLISSLMLFLLRKNMT
ncbi:hypothetical protein DSECCO2_502970 [anaerobic digester metagenome]